MTNGHSFQNYALTLSKQLGLQGIKKQAELGEAFTEKDLDHFSDEQIIQLHELYEATHAENEPPPSGDNPSQPSK